MKEIHDLVLTFLLKWREKHPGFTFALRKSDFNKKLSGGYWFFGTEELLILSFWSGMDWKGRVPNISFCYNVKDKETYIQITARDSAEKNRAIEKVFSQTLGFEFSEGAAYFKRSPQVTYKDLIKNLTRFLEGDKVLIDSLIQEHKSEFRTKQNPRNRIGFITESEFELSLKKTLKHRNFNKSNFLPISLQMVEIRNYGPIKNMAIDNIPLDAQWIFLTGENGTGKTSILRALATAFTKGSLGLGPRTTVPGNYTIRLQLNKFGRNPRHLIKKGDKHGATSRKLLLLTDGLVSFGPIRLNIASDEFERDVEAKNIEELLKRPYLELFKTNGYLIDIGTAYNNSGVLRTLIKQDQEKLKYITEAITRICESIIDINFGRSVRYFEADENKNLFSEKGVTFRQLASGYKSVVAMISHMMLHLFYQQPEIDDPSTFRGIVLIDEIDLHFHPKMQKDLILKLSEIFPRIQFIVSTHSPIPLLGAPPNSVILRVKRDSKTGVFVTRMDDKVDFENLLPNSILTSPIFDLKDITPAGHNPEDILRVEDSYDKVQYNLQLERDIDAFMTGKRENELLALFSNKKRNETGQ